MALFEFKVAPLGSPLRQEVPRYFFSSRVCKSNPQADVRRVNALTKRVTGPRKRTYGTKARVGGHNQEFEQMYRPKLDELIDRVENHRQHEDLADVLPAAAEKGGSLSRIGDNRPEKSPATGTGVFHAGPDGKASCYQGLHDQPEVHRARDTAHQVAPQPTEDVAHTELNIISSERERYWRFLQVL